MGIRSLYICYFGVREPLVQTQVLPYLRELVDELSLEVHLLTFERDPIAKDEHEDKRHAGVGDREGRTGRDEGATCGERDHVDREQIS